MTSTLRRIAIHGGMAAIVLGIIGLMFAELATMWMTVSLTGRGSAKTVPPDTSAMRQRLPVIMALAGFAFVTVGELALYRLRKNRLPPLAPAPPAPDSTERLLEELLSKAEANSNGPENAVAPTAPSPDNSAGSPLPPHPADNNA